MHDFWPENKTHFKPFQSITAIEKNTFKSQEQFISSVKRCKALNFKSDQLKGFRVSKKTINGFRRMKWTEFSTKQVHPTQTSQLKNPDGGASRHIQLLPNFLRCSLSKVRLISNWGHQMLSNKPPSAGGRIPCARMTNQHMLVFMRWVVTR